MDQLELMMQCQARSVISLQVESKTGCPHSWRVQPMMALSPLAFIDSIVVILVQVPGTAPSAAGAHRQPVMSAWAHRRPNMLMDPTEC